MLHPRASLVLAPAALLLLVLACRTPEEPEARKSGAEIYALQLCANCHGEEGEGRSNGSPLRDLGRYWTREDLADYLADPQPWVRRDPRLAKLEALAGTEMAAYPHLSREERLTLADYLLGM